MHDTQNHREPRLKNRNPAYGNAVDQLQQTPTTTATPPAASNRDFNVERYFLPHMSLVPFASAAVFSASDIWANLVKTDLTLPPSSMEMMRQWSSSFTQHRAVFDSLWKIPRSCVNGRTS